MLALATTHEHDLPLRVQPLHGKASETGRVVAAVQAIQEPWRATDETPRVSVADTGISRDATMRDVNPWISRVSDTSTQATQALAAHSETWQTTDDGTEHVDRRIRSLPQRQARGMIVRTNALEPRAQARVKRQVTRAQAEWEKTCWHLGTRDVPGKPMRVPLWSARTRTRPPGSARERGGLCAPRRPRAASHGCPSAQRAVAIRGQREHHSGHGRARGMAQSLLDRRHSHPLDHRAFDQA
jgi:hypothetical protein